MDRTELVQLFERMNDLHVVVVGDVMLDKYWWGDVERISPEAPVPVVSLHRRESRLGGAANVALNCKALGAKVTIASVIGDDSDGALLKTLVEDAEMNSELLMPSKQRPTTTKTRIMSRQQQMLRIDDEITDELYLEEEHAFIDVVLKFLQRVKPDVLIYEDYNKGVLKENVVDRITAHCKEIGIMTAVDPKKRNFLAYRNVDIFKPNLKEVREALNIELSQVNDEALNTVHDSLKETLQHKVTFITLSEKGVFYNDSETTAIVPSHIRNIADVSGAGDTVIATASMVYALSHNAALMAEISNIAGGLVCEEVGVVPVKKDLLQEESVRLVSALSLS